VGSLSADECISFGWFGIGVLSGWSRGSDDRVDTRV
jgi:hypothetical protein